MTKRVIVGVFAHPDDEAFGPAGTLLRETKAGTELHLITLTAGENGTNPDELTNLREVRLEEWRAAGTLLGATGMYHLGYTDGTLDNMTFLKAVVEIERIAREVIAAHEGECEVELMSMDTNGISGHIDHIVASRAAHFVFYRLKEEGLPLSRLRLVCIPREHTGDRPSLAFVFMEPGRWPEEIDETIDNREYLDEIYAIMRAHHTQRGDGDWHISQLGERVAIDYFIVKE